MNSWIRRIIFCICVIGGLELIARQIVWRMPAEIQQKYSNLQRKDSHTADYIVNGRGARGRWPHQRQMQIALIGSSMVALKHLPDQETWPAILEKQSPIPIHVDNLSFGFNKLNSTTFLLEALFKQKVKYDAIVLQPSIHLNKPLSATLSATYHSRWFYGESWCAACSLTVKFLQRRLNIEYKSFQWPILNQLNSLLQPPQRPNYYSRELRQKFEREGRTIYVDTQFSEEDIQTMKNELRQMFDAALAITANVIWMPECAAYHPHMKPSYNSHYMTIFPASENENSPLKGFYKNTKSIADAFIKTNMVTRQIAKEKNISEMDWCTPIIAELPDKENLYIDEFHLSKAGSAEVARILSKDFNEFAESMLKIKIDKSSLSRSL